jgi:hypothetical protein
MVGFATGTATLLGPARWVSQAVRESAWRAHENGFMVVLILAYVAASFVLSRWLFDRMRRTDAVGVKCGIPCVATLAAGISLWGWMNPAVYARAAGGGSGQVALASGAQFVFGPYPDRAKLAQLKAEGVTAVISLQHPAVLPFEPQGIADEKKATAELGLAFIHAPMLPWVSSNEDSLNIIRGVARRGAGKYYVHCGLGRDRTSVVMRMLQQDGAKVASQGTPAARTFRLRLDERGNWMERGTFQELEKDVWLIPYPNHHEMYGNMLAGQVAHVLLLLDPADREQAGWIAESREAFTRSRVPFTVKTLWRGDRAHAASIARFARTLPRPLAIVVPFTPPQPRAEVATTFLAGYGAAVGHEVRLEPPRIVEAPSGVTPSATAPPATPAGAGN